MSKNCPFNTCRPSNIKIPTVPVDTYSVIPFVPKPHSNISYQMGGTTPPQDSINNLNNNFSSKKIYQINAPHQQNTLTPCSIINKKPADPNSNSRKCYNIYSSRQNIMGNICTTPGTDGFLYSKENMNGNADWVRGNNFGVNYGDNIIDDRKKYYNKIPYLNENNKTYITYDQFYPISNKNIETNIMNKKYPYTRNYTPDGYPEWRYPYSTTQIDSRSPTELILKKESKKDIIDLIENFSENSNNLNSHNIFWVGIIVVFLSFFICSKVIK